MTIYFFTKGNRTVASSRQRAFAVADALVRDEAVEAVVCAPAVNEISTTPWPGKLRLILAAYRNLLKAGRGDVVVVQRALKNKYFFPALVAAKLVRGFRLIFDLDDAVFLHAPRRSRMLARLADAVTAGSHELQAWAARYNRNTALVPTLLDHERYARISPKAAGTFTIGWIGDGPAHFDNLLLLVPVLRRLAQEGLSFRFLLIGSRGSQELRRAFEIPGVEVEFIDALAWDDPNAAPNALREFSVGVMPLTDSPWNRGKCAFKALEYMAAAIPTIASDVGENSYLIQDGENGLLARTTDEWVEKITRLERDPALRRRLGLNGQETVRASYSYAGRIPLIRSILVAA